MDPGRFTQAMPEDEPTAVKRADGRVPIWMPVAAHKLAKGHRPMSVDEVRA